MNRPTPVAAPHSPTPPSPLPFRRALCPTFCLGFAAALATLPIAAADPVGGSSAVPPETPPTPAISTAPTPLAPATLRKPGPVLPENIDLWGSLLDDPQVDWMKRQRLRVFGWLDAGYTWSDTGGGLLRLAPRPNRFSEEVLLNQAALVMERTLDPHDWSWGARAEFWCGADAALLRPLNGFGPDDNPRFGTDFRQLYASVHLPVLTDGGIDLKGGRIYVPIGYDSTMSPYRPMYSAAYAWIYTQTGAATGGSATWHVNPQLDVIAAVTLGYNTFFELRGDSPCYLTRAIYWLTPEKQTRVLGTLYTGPQPIATSKGHVAEWQTVVEGQIVHDWTPRFTQALELNLGWDHDDPVTGGTSEWYGAYTVGIFHLHSQWDLHLRAEVFGDQDGSRTGTAATYGEFAAGFNYMPRPWLNFRPEIRCDVADQPVFGLSHETERERDQLTIAIDCLVKF